MKKCTNSVCRRKFSPASSNYAGCCPYCGRKYPRIQYERFEKLLLEDYGNERIKVIKILSNALGVGLYEAKCMVDTASTKEPCLITADMINQGDLFNLKKELIKAGAHCRGCC